MRHPTNWLVFMSGKGGNVKILNHRPFPGGSVQSTNTGYHPLASQAGRAGDPQPNSIGLGELGGLLCHHRILGHRSPDQYRVQDRLSRPAPVGGTQIYPAPPCAQHISSAGGGHGRFPQTGCLSTDKGNQVRGVDHRADFHSDWENMGA